MYLEILVCIILLYLFIRRMRPTVYRFYKPWCGACKKSQSAFDRFSIYCALTGINCKQINLDNATVYEKNLYTDLSGGGGSGVPFVVAVNPNGQRYTHDGERTASAYYSWINSI